MYRFNFHNHPCIEYTGDEQTYVQFLNNNNIIYDTKLTKNSWAYATPQHFIPWTLKAYINNNIVFTHQLNLKNKKVIIINPYNTLGDLLLWLPIYQEFKNIHQCQLIIQVTEPKYINIIHKSYPELIFTTNATSLINESIYAIYSPTLQYVDEYLSDNVYPNTQSVQQAMCKFLNIPYKPFLPLIDSTDEKPLDEKYICLTEFGSSNPWKCWITKEYGWHKISKYFNERGYKVIPISNEPTNLIGNHIINKSGCQLKEMIQLIKYADLTIGASTGPLIVSLSLNKPTISINTCTWPDENLPIHYVYNHTEGTCFGCYTWEPEKKPQPNTCPNRHPFPECSENITPEMVIKEIKKIIGEN
jgi:autotransporter strand-loop-strand O-heptosyltransferase